jgi:phosphate uptake regulator
MKIIERNLHEVGKSLLVTLPKDWTKNLKLNKESKVRMMVTEQGQILIAPDFIIKKEKKQVTISFDKFFQRRFFREYFKGNQKITILFSKSRTSLERKDLYSFLKRFLNLAIIEENETKIVLKLFRIEDISITEALRRMHFLYLNILEEVKNKNDKVKIRELRDSMTKFYYLLVMQVRIYLTEGEYAKENQISLIRALDLRMVSEKIQRLTSLVTNFEKLSKIQKEDLEEFQEYYVKSFHTFIKEDFESAIKLWNPKIRKDLEKKKTNAKKRKDVLLYSQASNLGELYRYAKEISMLVR